MARFGTPSFPQGRSTAYIFVTVEIEGESARLVRWKGSSVKGIKRAARERYGKDAVLQFGAVIWLNSYGAH